MIAENLADLKKEIPEHVKLVVVSKTKPVSEIIIAYQAGQKVFGENKVQEMLEKYEQLPGDVEWHLIGHLQTNKVKHIAPFVSLIHSVDSLKLLEEINKQGSKFNRVIKCLLQIHIAKEETKFGLSFDEAEQLIKNSALPEMQFASVVGFMGMATNTDNEEIIRNEFRGLREFFSEIKSQIINPDFEILSMGMSGDYKIAIEEGSTMIRVGSAIFGERSIDSSKFKV